MKNHNYRALYADEESMLKHSLPYLLINPLLAERSENNFLQILQRIQMSIPYIRMAYELSATETGCDAIEANHVGHASAVAWRRPAPMLGPMVRAH